VRMLCIHSIRTPNQSTNHLGHILVGTLAVRADRKVFRLGVVYNQCCCALLGHELVGLGERHANLLGR